MIKKIFILLFMVACSTINKQSENVKIVNQSQIQNLSTCTMKSPIFESSEFGQNQLVISLKNKTSSNGGNVLLSNMKTERSFGFLNPTEKTSGVVYDCPEEVLKKLNDFGQW